MFTPLAMMIIFRIQNKEVQLRELEGYREYCRKVRYRVVPGVW
jgi:protein-S-isoprenylcysteine O-methyltransferase Ste14